jgi:serine/threonine protein kinase
MIFAGTHKFAHTPDANGDSFAPEWKDVAIKQTKPNALDLRGTREIGTYDDMERKCQQIKTLLRLQGGSPHVLYLYEYFISPGKDVFLVTERLGQELDEWRSHCGEFKERMAIDICRTLLNSLCFISSRGVVHRGITLQNVVFRKNGDFRTLVLVDFGMAKVLEAGETTKDFCGLQGSIAPEIYQGMAYRFEVDMFAFGVLLFSLLSAMRPFPSNNSQILKRDTIMLQYNVKVAIGRTSQLLPKTWFRSCSPIARND